MSKNLLIVESPAKCKTIVKYLGSDFAVLASYGHLRDLPSAGGKSVHPDQDFAVDYEITEDHIRHANAIIAEARRASTIYLATDLDREGEAISWHILEILKDKNLLAGKTVHRVTFSEITKQAVLHAVANPRDILMPLVNAQQARRTLDYLVGYNLSPVLWKKVKAGLSAGRVQSPALRMIVEREDEIDAFEPKEHWTVSAHLLAKQIAFVAKLVQLDGKKYDPFQFNHADAAKALEARLKAEAGSTMALTRREAKERQRRPYAPFTTSTLQQDAANRLGFASARTMKVAQSLYEGIALQGGDQVGLITYMRTDAVNLSEDALTEIRRFIKGKFSAEYLPEHAVRYQAKSKNAQEAHEGIRPSSVDRTPESMASHLDADQLKLYTLIWQRAVACQMAPAKLHTVSFEFELPSQSIFRASGSTVTFPGFLAVYNAKVDDKEEEAKLPSLHEGEKAAVQQLITEQKFTEPPPRFNEGSLVKHLEELDIGRPSTYASIIETLKKRNYVEMDGKRFLPTEIGRAVGHFLEEHFAPYVDYQFTAHLEDDLDAIARGEREWKPLLREFWGPFKAMVDDKSANASRQEAKGRRMIGEDPKSGLPVFVFVGKFGGTIAVGNLEDKSVKPRFYTLPSQFHVSSVTLEDIVDELRFPINLGEDHVVHKGRHGPYVQYGELRASLGEDQDPLTLTLNEAREIVREMQERLANRDIAKWPSGIQIRNGKFGPYASDGKVFATIPPGKDPKDYTEEEAKALIEAKKAGGGGGGKKGKWKGKQQPWKKGGKPQFKPGGGKFTPDKESRGSSKASSIDGLPM